jgi:hypothetical protein
VIVVCRSRSRKAMRVEPYSAGSQVVSGAVKVGTWLPQNKPA